MRNVIHRTPGPSPDEHVVSCSCAILGLLDGLLWRPSPSVAAAAVHLLYGPEVILPDALRAEIGNGAPPSLVSRIVASAPLGALLPSLLGSAAVWRADANGL